MGSREQHDEVVHIDHVDDFAALLWDDIAMDKHADLVDFTPEDQREFSKLNFGKITMVQAPEPAQNYSSMVEDKLSNLDQFLSMIQVNSTVNSSESTNSSSSMNYTLNYSQPINETEARNNRRYAILKQREYYGPYTNFQTKWNNVQYVPDDQAKYAYGTDKIYTQILGFYGLLLAKMTIGTTAAPKNNTLSLLVDTGSSWNWVMSCNKNEEGYWRGRVCPYFDETESSTLTPTGTRKSITYA